jgi:hypothetical protein
MPQLRLPTHLFETLVGVADRMAWAADPWWVIGSAAAALHGLDAESIGDVDIVTSAPAARRLLAKPDIVVVDDGGTGVFRSEVFARLAGLPLKVEILGGLSVRGAPLAIATRVAMAVGTSAVYVPSCDELVSIFRLFGRPKDIVRAEALAALD